jgi:hypothetical protein
LQQLDCRYDTQTSEWIVIMHSGSNHQA